MKRFILTFLCVAFLAGCGSDGGGASEASNHQYEMATVGITSMTNPDTPFDGGYRVLHMSDGSSYKINIFTLDKTQHPAVGQMVGVLRYSSPQFNRTELVFNGVRVTGEKP